MTARVAPTAEYSEYVEYGTRFMESQPYMRPAFGEQKQQFKSDMQKTCEMRWNMDPQQELFTEILFKNQRTGI